jgi:hypothetical protein
MLQTQAVAVALLLLAQMVQTLQLLVMVEQEHLTLTQGQQ